MPSLGIDCYPPKYGNCHSGHSSEGRLTDYLRPLGAYTSQCDWSDSIQELPRVLDAVSLVTVCILEKEGLLLLAS